MNLNLSEFVTKYTRVWNSRFTIKLNVVAFEMRPVTYSRRCWMVRYPSIQIRKGINYERSTFRRIYNRIGGYLQLKLSFNAVYVRWYIVVVYRIWCIPWIAYLPCLTSNNKCSQSIAVSKMTKNSEPFESLNYLKARSIEMKFPSWIVHCRTNQLSLNENTIVNDFIVNICQRNNDQYIRYPIVQRRLFAFSLLN